VVSKDGLPGAVWKGAAFRRGAQARRSHPGARFVALEGRNHLMLEGEPAWARFLEEVRAFLRTGSPAARQED
jgi:hypothetical protein